MKKQYSLKSKIEFNKILNKGKKIRSKYFLISYKPSNEFKIGISIPKKLGNAVFRNYNKRIIKQTLPQIDLYDQNFHIVLVAKKEYTNLSIDAKQKVLINELKKIDGK